MKKLMMTAIVLFGVLASAASQSTMIESETITIHMDDSSRTTRESGEYEKDFVFGGSDIEFSGRADDVYLMSRDAVFEGVAENGLFVLASQMVMDGRVGNNVHGAAEDVKISGLVGGTSFLAASSIHIDKEAVLEGSLISASGKLRINGPIHGNLIAGAGEVIIDARIDGDVYLAAGNITITEEGYIAGDLTYSTRKEISGNELSNVGGNIEFKKLKPDHFNEDFRRVAVVICIVFALAFIVGGVLILLLPGIRSLLTREREIRQYGLMALWGLIPVFCYPVLTIVTVILLPWSIALMLACFPLLMINGVFGLTMIGQMLFKVFRWNKPSILLHFLFALALYIPLSLIPILSFFLALGVQAFGAGLIISKLFKAKF